MSWSVVQTYGSSERKAVENLQRQGFDAFCPFYVRSPLSHSRGPRELPLFPCYAFIDIPQNMPWAAVNNTLGVIRLLTNRNKDNPKPLYVSDEYITGLTFLLKQAGDNRIPRGTIVRIRQKESPFADLVGTVISMDKDDRLRVLMSLFNRDVVVEFDASSVEIVEANPDG
jgi:transcriptional antiterminator RfaH